MAISYAKVSKIQCIFRQLTGLTTSEFEKIVAKVRPEWLCCIAHYTKVSYKNSRNHFKRRHTNFGKFVKYIAFN